MHAAARSLGSRADVSLAAAASNGGLGSSHAHLDIEESRRSIQRRRGSATTGKTHFRLAPGVLSASSSSSNDVVAAAAAGRSDTDPAAGHFAASHAGALQQEEQSYADAWRAWMGCAGTTCHASSSKSATAASTPFGAPKQPSSSSSSYYDAAWQRWMGGTRADTATYSNQSASASAEPSAFESVPREATYPIMSRLPLSPGEVADEAAADPTSAGSNLDYLTSEGGHAGLLAGAEEAVKYTRARLPVLDDESEHLWCALHELRPLSNDYADGYEVASRSKRASALSPGAAAAAAAAAAATTAPHPIAEGMDAADCPAFATAESLASKRALSLIQRLFNWSELPDLPLDLEYTWYGVAFRSKRREGSESINFYEADRQSHEEAVDCGGLLMYWYGTPNATTGHNLATCIWTSREDARRASSLPLHARAAAHAGKAYDSFELSRYAVHKAKGVSKLRLEEWPEA